MNLLQTSITKVYDALQFYYDEEYLKIKRAYRDNNLRNNENLTAKKNQCDNQFLKVREDLNVLSVSTERLTFLSHECLLLIEREKQKTKKVKEYKTMAKEYKKATAKTIDEHFKKLLKN